MKIWFDGEIREQRDTPVSVKSHTLHYGTAVFEGIRSYLTPAGATPFKLGEHIGRLFRSAHAVGLDIPFSEADLHLAVHQVLEENGLTDAYIRPLVFLGEGAMGLDVQTIENANPVHVMISAWEWASYFDHGKMAGIRAVISKHRRVFSSSALAQAKASGHYLGSYCAHMDAKKCGYDEAILLDEEGYLAEASSANLFFVSRGEICTPLVKHALNGITRHTVMKIGFDNGIRVTEQNSRPFSLLAADEAFLTGTACEIVPVISVNGKRIGEGKVGEITQLLAQEFSRLVRCAELQSIQPHITANQSSTPQSINSPRGETHESDQPLRAPWWQGKDRTNHR